MASLSADGQIEFEGYELNEGISMAANMREAFRSVAMLRDEYERVLAMVDAPVLMVPSEEFLPTEEQTLYSHAFSDTESLVVAHTVLPDLNSVAVFGIGRDLKKVFDEHFPSAQYIAAVAPVWRHLHQRSHMGVRAKLYGYFHGSSLTVFCYGQHRLKFCNTFSIGNGHDAVYFLLYVWKQLAMQAEHDELHLVGSIAQQEWLVDELRRYVKRVYVINPAGDFNRSAVARIEGMPYDMMTLFVRGR